MNEQAIRFRIGLFVLGGLILLGVLITLFGGFPGYFRPSTSYTILFDNAPGVDRGTPVRRSGVKIGEVRKVTLENETGKVEVEIRIDAGYTLRQGDKATLVQGLLGGDTAIAFLPPGPPEPPPDTKPVPEGAQLKGFTQADTGTVLQKTAEIMPEAKVVLDKIDKMTPLLEEALKEFRDVAKSTREAIPELRKTNQQIQDLTKATKDFVPDLRKTTDEIQVTARMWGKVGERADILLRTNEDKLVKTLDEFELVVRRTAEMLNEENQKLVRDILRNTSKGTANLDVLAKNTEDFLKESRGTLKQLNGSLLKADEVLSDLQKTTKPLGERSESILRNLDESTEKVNKILSDARELLGAAARSDGTLQRLLSDPALYNNLNEAACSVNRLMPRVDRVLRDVEIFADKIARHPEALGVGGVVRPGSGLKESPTPYRIIPTHP